MHSGACIGLYSWTECAAGLDRVNKQSSIQRQYTLFKSDSSCFWFAVPKRCNNYKNKTHWRIGGRQHLKLLILCSLIEFSSKNLPPTSRPLPSPRDPLSNKMRSFPKIVLVTNQTINRIIQHVNVFMLETPSSVLEFFQVFPEAVVFRCVHLRVLRLHWMWTTA